MNAQDWLALCRRVVAGQRRILESHSTIAERTRYDGVGEGGDRALVIDRLCEDTVFAELEPVAAEVPLIAVSEERGEVRLGGDGEPQWVVIDPIDGSLNARRRLPPHSVSIAVASGPTMADVHFGYVFDFGAGEEVVAVAGEGARLDGELLPPLDPEARFGEREMEVVGLEAADPDVTAGPVEALAGRVHRLRIIGSIAISVCAVAAGRLDGMATLGPSRSVDVAAAQLALREAGGEISFGGSPPAETGLALTERYPVAAATGPTQLETLLNAQHRSPALQNL